MESAPFDFTAGEDIEIPDLFSFRGMITVSGRASSNSLIDLKGGELSFCSTLSEERVTVFSKSSSTAPIAIRHFSRIFTRILWMASFSFSSPERLSSRLSIRFHSQMGSVHIHLLKPSNSLFRFR